MKKNKSIVIGCGRLGSRIATLLSTKGRNVIMIDKSQDSFRKLGDGFNGYTIEGDATDIEFLEKQYINDANTVIITTNDDDVNIFLADVCQYIFDVPNIYVRLSDNNKEKIIDSNRIKAIYPFILSINEFGNLFKDNGGE